MTDINQDQKKERGRPKGSRNKTKIQAAQYSLDNLTTVGVEVLEALLTNDKVYLKTEENVTNALRFQVAKVVVEKGLTEKEKEELEPVQSAKGPTGPRVISTAKKVG